MKFIFSILLFPVLAFGSEYLTHDRMPTNSTYPATPWKGYVGVEGGIPNRSTISELLATTASAATINTALDNCASNSVVLLTNGTFTCSSGIRLDKDGVTLRGLTNSDGTAATTLNFTTDDTDLVRIGSAYHQTVNEWYMESGFNNGYTTRTVSTGITRGSTRITVSATPTGLGARQWMMFSAPSDSGKIGGSGFTVWDYTGDNHPATFIVWTTNVSGTTIDFWPPFQADYWDTAATVEIHYRTPADTIELAGIENIKITRSSTAVDGHALCIVGTKEAWAQNCILETHSSASAQFGISQFNDFRTEIRRCNIKDASNLSSESYAIRTAQTSCALWTDNIIQGWPNVHALFGCNLTVFYGNIVTNVPYISGILSQILFIHAAHNSYNLVEHCYFPRCVHDTGSEPGDGDVLVYNGNWVPGWDGSDGGKDDDAIYIAWQTGACSYTETYSIRRFSVLNSIIGRAGNHDIYVDVDDCSMGANDGIFRIELVSSNTFRPRNNYNLFNTAIPAAEAYTGGETATTSYFMTANDLGHPRWPPFDPTSPSTVQQTNIQAGHRFSFVTNFVGASEGEPAPVNTRTKIKGIRLRR